MTGKFTQWKEGSFTAQDFQPPERVWHGWYDGSIVSLEPNTWMLEHMKGSIPVSLPFGLMDSLVSQLDFITPAKALLAYGKLVIIELIFNQKI